MGEHYRPSPDELSRLKLPGESLQLSGDGVFATLQGEGVTAGSPAIFIRLQNCNLRCGFEGQGWRCDAWYTWDRTTKEFWQETQNVEVPVLQSDIVRLWDKTFGETGDRRLVVTGGEPLLQQEKLIELLSGLVDWEVEIETNGTIMPDDSLSTCQINCSPKLEGSGNRLLARYRPEVLRKIATFPNHWFKFVIATDDDLLEMRQIVGDNGISYSNTILMSEGVDKEVLRRSDAHLRQVAEELGSLTTVRNHIFWFGDTRAT